MNSTTDTVLPLEAPRASAALALMAFVLCYPLFSMFVVPHEPAASSALGEIRARLSNEAPRWLYASTALFLALRWQRCAPAVLGLRKPDARTVLVGVLGCVLAFALAVGAKLALRGWPQPPDDPAAIARMVHGSLAYAAIMAVGAGFVEESLYRSILITEVTRLTRRPVLSVFLSGVAFVTAHGLTYNWVQLSMAAMATIALSVIYVWRRDLAANVLAHALIDLVSFAHALQ